MDRYTLAHYAKFFFKYVEVKRDSSCWLWRGTKNERHKGEGVYYGVMMTWKYNKSSTPAHRFSYEFFKKDIEEGMHIDHICGNTLCVNPKHLQEISPSDNILKGTAPAAINSRKTHCKWGHSFSGDNLLIRNVKNGKTARCCKICRGIQNKKSQLRIKSKVSHTI